MKGLRRKRRAIVAGLLAVEVAGTLVARLLGYPIGKNTVVRCRQGHLFTTIWLPGGSLKAIRLGWWRFQRCPVGGHWTIVSPVRPAALSRQERRSAARMRDVRIP